MTALTGCVCKDAWVTGGGRGMDGLWCPDRDNTAEQNGETGGVIWVVRASRHWVGVTCGASFWKAAANHAFRWDQPRTYRSEDQGGDCPGLEPRGLSGRQGEQEKRGAGSKGRKLWGTVGPGTHYQCRESGWQGSPLAHGVFWLLLWLSLSPNQGPARAAKALHTAFLPSLPCPAPV